jgi:hypothetical protein
MTINNMNKRIIVGLLLVAGYHRQDHEGQEKQFLHNVCAGVP